MGKAIEKQIYHVDRSRSGGFGCGDFIFFDPEESFGHVLCNIFHCMVV